MGTTVIMFGSILRAFVFSLLCLYLFSLGFAGTWHGFTSVSVHNEGILGF